MILKAFRTVRSIVSIFFDDVDRCGIVAYILCDLKDVDSKITV